MPLPLTSAQVDARAWEALSATWGAAAHPEAPSSPPRAAAPLGSRGNPIRCTSVPNAERYLAALRDAAGNPVRFRRFALLGRDGEAPVDGWLLRLSDGSDRRLHIDPNAAEDTLSAPEGFTLVGFRPLRGEAWLVPLLGGE